MAARGSQPRHTDAVGLMQEADEAERRRTCQVVMGELQEKINEIEKEIEFKQKTIRKFDKKARFRTLTTRRTALLQELGELESLSGQTAAQGVRQLGFM